MDNGSIGGSGFELGEYEMDYVDVYRNTYLEVIKFDNQRIISKRISAEFIKSIACRF